MCAVASLLTDIGHHGNLLILNPGQLVGQNPRSAFRYINVTGERRNRR